MAGKGENLQKINRQLREQNELLEKENRMLFKLLVENNVKLPEELEYLRWKTLLGEDSDIPF